MSVKIGMSFTGSNINSSVYRRPNVAVSAPRLTPEAILRSGTAALNFQRANPRPVAIGATNLGNMFSPRPTRGCGCGH